MKRVLILIIIFCILLSGCNVQKKDVADNKQKQEYKEEITDRSGMADVFEDSALKLQLDFDNFNIVVSNKSNNSQWFSNPKNIESDPFVKPDYADLMKAQISFSYISNRAKHQMDSYNDCIKNEQYKVYKIANGMRIEYTFGDLSYSVEDIPKKLSEERYNKFVKNNTLLDEDDRKNINLCYDYSKDAKTYTFKKNALGMKANNAAKAFQKAGYSYEDLVMDSQKFNLPVEATEKMYFVIPVEYTVSNGKFDVKVPVSEIISPKESPINTLNVLEFFGAKTSDEAGYIFVPDGCGALINFDKNTHNFYQLSVPVYIEDKNVGKTQKTVNRENVSLPVFGMKSGNNAFYAAIKDADAIANINATRANTNSSYNTVSSSYIINNCDTVALGNPDNPSGVLVSQERPYEGDISIQYTFLQDNNANYQGMAKDYRNSLISSGYKKLNSEEKMPFFLELIGAVDGTKSFLGFNYSGINAITTFKQAQSIIDEHKKVDIKNIKLMFSGWFNDGYNQYNPSEIKIENVLGSKSDLLSLNKNVDLYPSVQFLSFKTLKGFSLNTESARTIDQQISRLYENNKLTNTMEKQEFIVSPRLIGKTTDKVLRFFTKNNLTKMYVNDLGNQFYADYNKKNMVDKQSSALINQSQTEKLAKQVKLIMNGNTVRTGKDAFGVINAPLYSSSYFICDEEVPFYQMVFHGLFYYAGKPINLSPDMNESFLKSIQYGASVYFLETYSDVSELIQSEFFQFNSTYYKDWINVAQNMYSQANTVLSPLADKQIIDYIKIAPQVYSTVYEGGTVITVNYSDSDYVLSNQKTVKAKSFLKE